MSSVRDLVGVDMGAAMRACFMGVGCLAGEAGTGDGQDDSEVEAAVEVAGEVEWEAVEDAILGNASGSTVFTSLGRSGGDCCPKVNERILRFSERCCALSGDGGGGGQRRLAEVVCWWVVMAVVVGRRAVDDGGEVVLELVILSVTLEGEKESDTADGMELWHGPR